MRPDLAGNERILNAHGGKVRPSAAQTNQLADFRRDHDGQTVLLVAIEVRALYPALPCPC